MVLEIKLKKEDPKAILLVWEGSVWRTLSKSLFLNELRKFPSSLVWEDFLERFSLLEEKIGKRYSIYLLSQRALLSSELEERLISKGITASVAKGIVQYCSEKGFLNDEQEVARLVAKELKKGHSAKAVLFKLRGKKRLDERLLQEALERAPSSDEDVLQKWLAKNAKMITRDDPLSMRKLMAKLCRKGFSPEVVFKTLGDN